MKSNVYALDLATGQAPLAPPLRRHEPRARTGSLRAGGRIYGATDAAAFALDARTGRVLWRRFLVTPTARFVDDRAAGRGRARLHRARSGCRRTAAASSTRSTRRRARSAGSSRRSAGRWRVPSEAGGGGAWQPPSVDGGEVFWGTANPYPYGGTPRASERRRVRGRALYTDSLLVTDARTGSDRLVRPGDAARRTRLRLPALADPRPERAARPAVFGAGKAGIVIAWDRATHRRLWQTAVGVHRNDHGPLPPHRVSVCPGLLGGVETPMASRRRDAVRAGRRPVHARQRDRLRGRSKA